MTAEERFALIQVKLERAKKHIQDLEVEVGSFLDTNPYVTFSEYDPQTRERTVYVKVRCEVPSSIVAIFGDAIHNLRSALDHLIGHLIEANEGVPDSKAEFPIFEKSAQYEAARLGKIKGLRQQAINLLDGIGPYKERRLPLWWLHKLDIADKHRALIAAGARPVAHSPTPSIKEKVAEMRRITSLTVDQAIPDYDNFFVAIPISIGVMKTGDVLKAGPDSEVHEDMKFFFDVTLNEPGIMEPQPILVTAHTIFQLVSKIVFSFKPYL